ncbi:hypothetical protein EYF80_066579 [Liparis tanakae]|uniref:Uncharacterized protein n=1 Tax=Liparis tanakae TaxID=230148 RepID=A0A4Z2E4N9_9TELE|nr:hypothetical protein EYF80_066579 [Liparis tanakae]
MGRNYSKIHVTRLEKRIPCLRPTAAVWSGGGGRGSGPAQLAELSHSGPSQSLPEHGRRQPHDPQTTSRPAGEGEGPRPGRGAEDGGGQ